MTTYTFNPCIPAFARSKDDKFNVQGFRKGMVAELFIIYLLYLAIIAIGTIKNKYREKIYIDFTSLISKVINLLFKLLYFYKSIESLGGNYHDGEQGDGQSPEKQVTT